MGYKCVVCGKVCDDLGVICLYMSWIYGGVYLNNFFFWCWICKKELIRKDIIMVYVIEFYNGY